MGNSYKLKQNESLRAKQAVGSDKQKTIKIFSKASQVNENNMIYWRGC